MQGSRRVNFKGVFRDCLFIISERCHHHTDISLRDLKDTATLASSAKTAQDCDVALAFTATQLEKQTYIAVQRFLTLVWLTTVPLISSMPVLIFYLLDFCKVMELDMIKKDADLHGLTSRADGLR